MALELASDEECVYLAVRHRNLAPAEMEREINHSLVLLGFLFNVADFLCDGLKSFLVV